MWVFHWLLSKQVRHAVDACRHVTKLTRSQSDLLAPVAVERLEQAVSEVRDAIRTGGAGDPLKTSLENLDRVVQKNLRPYPNPWWRENIEVFLVTGAVVLALRTFFIQPMAIPTGSAQPTLWGIEQVNMQDHPEMKIPGFIGRQIDKWWRGITYIHIVAKNDGYLSLRPSRLVFPFLRWQSLYLGDTRQGALFPSSFESIEKQARDAGVNLRAGAYYRKGDVIVKLKVTSGDHLFVNRMIYNFRRPHRGEIIVFRTDNLPLEGITQDTHYIKRLVALGDEEVRLGDDRHLVINGVRLDASTPGFENVYAFDTDQPPRENQYSGHLNGTIARQNGRGMPSYTRYFPNESTIYKVPPKHLLPMGDNTMNSSDGRCWGAISEDRLVGRASFVFWPISDRFGWGYR